MRVGIIGDGAMGTVCGLILAGNQGTVRIWGHDAQAVAAHQVARENTTFLPGFKVPDNIEFTHDAGHAMDAADFVLCAVPTQYIRATLAPMAKFIGEKTPVVSVAKGIENETLLRPTQIIEDVWRGKQKHAGKHAPQGGGGGGWHGPIAALSGPNISGEIARQQPATMVAATEDAALGKQIQQAFTCKYVRVYVNPDRVGVELAGAMKNVIAIAAGILDGLGTGHNAKAALLTRGLVEISRLGIALGAHAETFAGLAGLGDLVTTCFSPEGRNRSFGERIGKGETVAAALAHVRGVVEGMPTCQGVLELAKKPHVEMPISAMLHAVLFEGVTPVEGIAGLMSRQPKRER